MSNTAIIGLPIILCIVCVCCISSIVGGYLGYEKSNAKNCEMSDWSSCSNGKQTRTIKTQKSMFGEECVDKDKLEQTCEDIVNKDTNSTPSNEPAWAPNNWSGTPKPSEYPSSFESEPRCSNKGGGLNSGHTANGNTMCYMGHTENDVANQGWCDNIYNERTKGSLWSTDNEPRGLIYHKYKTGTGGFCTPGSPL